MLAVQPATLETAQGYGEGEGRLVEGMETMRPALVPVAELVSEGLQNYEIAARLHYSIRAIENMVMELYTALGVPGGHRVKLARAIDRYLELQQIFGEDHG